MLHQSLDRPKYSLSTMDINGEPSSSSSVFKLFGKTIVMSEKVDSQDDIIMAAEEEEEEEIGSEKATKMARLACPRCKSKETKFCYFNNYNVNQPRHFCRACHRYWTAGGALRNVPVGAGRRKNRALPQGGGSAGAEGGGGGGGGMMRLVGGEEAERWLGS